VKITHKIWIAETGLRCAIIPLGTPLNQKYKVFSRGGRGFMRSSNKDIDFKLYMNQLCQIYQREIKPIPKMMKGKKFIDKNVIMWIEVYDENNRRDIDAVEKSVMDSMNGVLYEDDSQVWDKHTTQYIDKENPRIEVRCAQEKRFNK